MNWREGVERWLARALAPFGLTVIGAARLQAERDRASEVASDFAGKLAHERRKVAKLRALRDALTAEIRARGDLRQQLGALQHQNRQLFRSYKQLRRQGEVLERRAAFAEADRVRLFGQLKRLRGLEPPPEETFGAALPRREPRPRTPPQLRVMVAGEGPTLFELIEGVHIGGPAEDPSRTGPLDALVLLRPDRQPAAAAAVPEHVWQAVARGDTRLVWDDSPEGVPPKQANLRRVHQLMADKGLTPERATYVTQDRLFRPGYLTFCENHGVSPMKVVIYDYFVHKSLLKFPEHGPFVFQDRYKRVLAAPRRGRRAFLSLNFSPRPHKVLFLLRLLRDGLWDRGFVSFGGFERLGLGRAEMLRKMYSKDGFEDAMDEVAPLLPRLDDMGQVLFGMDEAAPGQVLKTAIAATELHEYRQSWFTVVTESEMSPRLHRITEKTLKPLLNFHPFLLLGSAGSLKLVRDYGFQTFGGIFDESYDEVEDSRRRFDLVYDQLVALTRLDEAELDRMDEAAAEIVRFNAHWGLVELPRLFRDFIAPGALEQILDRAAGREADSLVLPPSFAIPS